ncbi:MAG: F0F1 ATP synthase subunit gamma [Candidatus Woesebacteria bacterium]|nr:MAG: F0F1 ATP synthase subunit gamma [Candidatus Woesebacteria bacterium]
MINKKLINEELEQVKLLDEVTQSYAFISSVRMKKVREGVVSARDFLESLNIVFSEVLYSYRKEIEKLRKKSKNKITFLSHNGRTVCVFLAANTKLYGDIIRKTFNFFMEDVKSHDVEATVVGKYGLLLFKQKEPERDVTYFDFPDSGIDVKLLGLLMAHLVQYDEVRFYYPKFKNVIYQSPSVYSISSGASFESNNRRMEHFEYLFEPDLESILVFFEKEVFSSSFQQTISESQLSKFAARLVSMDQANQRIKRRFKDLEFERLRLTHSIFNRKQTQSISSMSTFLEAKYAR